MRPFDYLPGRSRIVFSRKMGTKISPGDSIIRFLTLLDSYLQLSLKVLSRINIYKSKINHSPRSSHD